MKFLKPKPLDIIFILIALTIFLIVDNRVYMLTFLSGWICGYVFVRVYYLMAKPRHVFPQETPALIREIEQKIDSKDV